MQLVEPFTHDLKFEDLNPAAIGSWRKSRRIEEQFLSVKTHETIRVTPFLGPLG
jgi:hypothetical protein